MVYIKLSLSIILIKIYQFEWTKKVHSSVSVLQIRDDKESEEDREGIPIIVYKR